MTLEKAFTGATKAASDAGGTAVRVVDAAIKKVWSVLDAAVEKHHPSEVLSQTAIQSIQGKKEG